MTGRGVRVFCDRYDTVLSLKVKYKEKDGIPVDQVRLIYAGKQLENERTLNSYGINTESMVHAVLRLRGGFTPYEVRTITGETIIIDTLEELKLYIQEKEGYFPDEQTFSYEWRLLSNEEKPYIKEGTFYLLELKFRDPTSQRDAAFSQMLYIITVRDATGRSCQFIVRNSCIAAHLKQKIIKTYSKPEANRTERHLSWGNMKNS